MSEFRIAKLVAGGDGLAFDGGKAVFIAGVLPGERVEARVTERRKDFDRARLVKVIDPSPSRVLPACSLAGECGGCDWMHISYEEQLRQKVSLVRETLRRTGGIEIDVLEIEPSRPLASRNRAQLHRDGEGRLGYMAAAAHRIVPVRTCPIVVPGIEAFFAGVEKAPEGLDRFTVFSDGAGAAAEGRDEERDLSVVVRGKRIQLSVGCFFQSNLMMLEKLVPVVVDGLSGATAADLYCGVGLFASFLAPHFSRVICVESSGMSIGYARRNVGGEQNEFHPMSAESWLASGAARGPFDAVVVDPPRIGLSPVVRAWIGATRPTTVRYVSCNSVTLAHDLAQLLREGMLLEEIRLFDFYPQTSHVEAVARLRGPR